jgi:hypothetical protein
MGRRIIHQWKDWLLEYDGDDRYELLHKHNQSVHSIVAKNPMDAENQCRQIMANLKGQED